ncbi:hypothetical protein [Actinomadura roseirufa]|uniref:hypothetical protein n=1 Tax=Actinomadura roseirufa TaxID=2094049 RepID=UPI001F5F1132|nr:hypothetical protein [Actinomadura roseirufa]
MTELTGQPYRGANEREDRIHASIAQIRIALNYWEVGPDLELPPRSLSEIKEDVRLAGRLLDKVDYLALGKCLPGLIEELLALWHSGTKVIRREVAELLARTLITAKGLAYRLGYVDLVTVAIDRATWMAKVTDKPELVAFATEERCQVFFATGAYMAGRKSIDLMHRDFDPIIETTESGLAIIGSLHLRSAIMAVRDTRLAKETRRSNSQDYLEQAQEIAERIGRDTNHYGLIFGPSNVRIHSVALSVELDDFDEALKCDEGFEPPRDLPVERSSHHYIDLSRAYLGAAKRDKALSTLARAEDLAPQHTWNHPMARETVSGLFSSYRTVPQRLRSLARKMNITAGT